MTEVDGDLKAVARGDEHAFEALVERHGPAMLRVARLYVRDRAVAEEVVQETWLSVLRSIDRFEGRSTLKTWLFTILTNTARRRSEREARSAPFSALGSEELESGALPDEGRFFDSGHPRWARAWSTVVASWDALPEDRLLAAETRGRFAHAVRELPETQRLVFTMRDVEGFPAEEVCNILGLTASNQRVLLHRARLKVRRALEQYFAEEGST